MDDKTIPLKIAFLTAVDPHDRRQWSGAIYYMAQALQKHCGEVSYIGPINALWEKVIGKLIHESSRLLLGKNFFYYSCFLGSKRDARVAIKRLAQQPFDVIVAPQASPEIAFLNTNIPIVTIDDATFALLHNYYPQFSNLLKRSAYETDTIQQLAIKRARIATYSTTWAASSAIKDYHANQKKVRVVPFGPNLEHPPSRDIIAQRKKTDQCKLLFIGAHWQRKGGDIAFETLLKLEERGIPVELIVCGCTPPGGLFHKRMTVIPFLNQNDERQRKKLEELFTTSDFLLLPTRSDCAPNVIREANAFGLPTITTNISGIPEIVKDGKNGFMLPLNAQGDAYAELIAKLYQNDQQYGEMVRGSREVFDQQNWDTWGLAMKEIFAELLNGASSISVS